MVQINSPGSQGGDGRGDQCGLGRGIRKTSVEVVGLHFLKVSGLECRKGRTAFQVGKTYISVRQVLSGG